LNDRLCFSISLAISSRTRSSLVTSLARTPFSRTQRPTASASGTISATLKGLFAPYTITLAM